MKISSSVTFETSSLGLCQPLVGPVAERGVPGVFALAEPQLLRLCDLKFHGLQSGAFVRSVAKWRMT